MRGSLRATAELDDRKVTRIKGDLKMSKICCQVLLTTIEET
jgi:hypothetical protein